MLWSRFDAIRSDLPSWSAMTRAELLSMTRRVAAYALSRQQLEPGGGGKTDGRRSKVFSRAWAVRQPAKRARDLLLPEPDERGYLSPAVEKPYHPLLDGKIPLGRSRPRESAVRADPPVRPGPVQTQIGIGSARPAG